SRSLARKIGRSASSNSLSTPGSSEPLGTVRSSKAHLAEKARPLAGVAGRPDRVDEEQHGVLVAIDEDFLDPEVVAGCLALGPKLLAGPAPERDEPELLALPPGVFVQHADHQHLVRLVVLHDTKHQAAELGEVELDVVQDQHETPLVVESRKSRGAS